MDKEKAFVMQSIASRCIMLMNESHLWLNFKYKDGLEEKTQIKRHIVNVKVFFEKTGDLISLRELKKAEKEKGFTKELLIDANNLLLGSIQLLILSAEPKIKKELEKTFALKAGLKNPFAFVEGGYKQKQKEVICDG